MIGSYTEDRTDPPLAGRRQQTGLEPSTSSYGQALL